MNDLPTTGHDVDEEAGQRDLRGLRDGYAHLSRDYLGRGDARLALHAMWTADLHVLQLLLLENGLDRAPDPAAQLAGVGEAVNRSLAAMSADDASPRRLLERSREAMVATFDESVHAMLTSQFLSLDHFEAAPAVTAESATRAVARRLGDRTCEQLVADLDATAHDCVVVARAMMASGDTGGALRQLHHGDLASFEAFLISSAMESGDQTLASVDLSWDLAARSFAESPVELSADADLGATVSSWRERLVVFGGWARAARLRASFLPVPVA